MPSLLTAFGTVLYYAPAQQALAHGDFATAPRNLTITQQGELLNLEWIAADGEVFWASFTLCPREGKRAVALRTGSEFLSAQPDGSVRHHPGTAAAPQHFILLDGQMHAAISYLTAHPWSLFSPIEAERMPRPSRVAENFALYICGKRIDLDDAGIPLPAITRASNNTTGEVIFQYDHFLVGRALLYRPLLYVCAFGGDPFFIMLGLFFATLEKFGDYHGGIVIVSDRAEKFLRDLIPASLHNNTRFIQRNYATVPEFTASRYKISDLALAGHQPVLYSDVDMLCTASIQPMLLDILHCGELCFTSEHADLPNLWADHADFTNWYGRPLFDADTSWAGPAKHQNSGLFGFTGIARTEVIFNLILSVIAQFQLHGTAKMFSYDQAYTSYTVQKLGLARPDFLNRHVQVLNHEAPDPANRSNALVHFNYGVQNRAKLEAIIKFYGALMPQAKVGA